jgi:two-component system, LytTR family, sensor kinase
MIEAPESRMKSGRPAIKWLLLCSGWVLLVFLFASQWYLYDKTRTRVSPFAYYLWWSWYMWAVLTPLVLWFANRHPIEARNWKHLIPVHIALSIGITFVQLTMEASIGWLRERDLSYQGALRHYFSQHIQMSLVAYWVLVVASQFYHAYDESRRKEIRAAQLETQLAEARLNLLRMQLQPHFLFNTLQAIGMLIHDDPQGAEEMLLHLSVLLRVSLDELNSQEVPLSKEVRFLEDYISIERRRFGDRLEFEIDTDDDALTCLVPTLILQPIVENAIHHGIGKHKEKDLISIRAHREDNRILLEVCNSTGVLEDSSPQILSAGVGLSNTQARITQLYGSNQSFELRAVEPKGVCAVLSIPARYAADLDIERRGVSV